MSLRRPDLSGCLHSETHSEFFILFIYSDFTLSPSVFLLRFLEDITIRVRNHFLNSRSICKLIVSVPAVAFHYTFSTLLPSLNIDLGGMKRLTHRKCWLHTVKRSHFFFLPPFVSKRSRHMLV